MSKKTKTITSSAWLDNEENLELERDNQSLEDALRSTDTQRSWRTYLLIGDAMRGDLPEKVNLRFSDRVTEELPWEESGAALTAPKHLWRGSPWLWGLSVGLVSVAFVAVVLVPDYVMPLWRSYSVQSALQEAKDPPIAMKKTDASVIQHDKKTTEGKTKEIASANLVQQAVFPEENNKNSSEGSLGSKTQKYVSSQQGKTKHTHVAVYSQSPEGTFSEVPFSSARKERMRGEREAWIDWYYLQHNQALREAEVQQYLPYARDVSYRARN